MKFIKLTNDIGEPIYINIDHIASVERNHTEYRESIIYMVGCEYGMKVKENVHLIVERIVEASDE